MKKLYSFSVVVILFLCTGKALAQEDYYVNPNIYGDFIFASDKLCLSYDQLIYITSANAPENPPINTINFYSPYSYASHNDYIYFEEIFFHGFHKFSAAQMPVTVGAEMTNVYMVRPQVIDDYIYFSDLYNQRISRIPLSVIYQPTQDLVLNNMVDPQGMVKVGNYIYLAMPYFNKIVRFDPQNPQATLEDVLTTGLSYPHTLIQDGNDILVSDSNANAIKRFNVNNPEGTLTTVLPINRPSFMRVRDNMLYIMLYNLKKIVRIPLASLALPNYDIPKITLHPNPATQTITLQSEQQGISGFITDSTGRIVQQFTTTETNSISIEKLTAGIYFIKIDSLPALRFIKK